MPCVKNTRLYVNGISLGQVGSCGRYAEAKMLSTGPKRVWRSRLVALTTTVIVTFHSGPKHEICILCHFYDISVLLRRLPLTSCLQDRKRRAIAQCKENHYKKLSPEQMSQMISPFFPGDAVCHIKLAGVLTSYHSIHKKSLYIWNKKYFVLNCVLNASADRSADHIIADIRRGQCDLYDSEALQELLKLSPEPEEVNPFSILYIMHHSI